MTEDRFKIALESNRDGIWDWDIPSGTVYLSKRWKEVLGYGEAEIGNKQEELEKRIHPEDSERVLASLLTHLKGTSLYYKCEYRVLCRDGTYKWVLDRGQVCSRSDDGKAERMVGTQTDITELVESRDRLNDFEKFLSVSPDLLAQVDANYRYVVSNENYATEFNMDSSELIGRTVAEVFGDEFFELVIKPNAEKTFKGDSVHFQEWYNYPNSGKRLMDASYSPLMSESGEWRGFLISNRDITAINKSKSLLDASEKRFHAIFEEAPLGIAVVDSNTGHIYEVNSRFAEIAGRSREEMQHIDWVSITHPDDVQEDLDNMELLNKGEIDSFTTEKRYIHPDDSVVWISMTVAPTETRFESGPRHLCMIQDISSRRQTDDALYQANLIIESSPVVLFRWRAAENWPVEFVSKNVAQFGYFAAELTSGEVPYSAMVHPDDLERVGREVETYSAAGKTEFRQEYRLISPKGVVFWIDDRTTVERDAQGNITHFQGILVDISDRKQAQEKLRRSGEKLAIAQRIAKVGSWDLDIKNNHLIWSDEVYRIFDLEPQEFGATYEAFLEKIHPDDRGQVNAAYLASVENKTDYRVEHRLLLADGKIKYVVEHGESSYDKEGKPSRSIGTIQDVTHRREAENLLLNSNITLSKTEKLAHVGSWQWDIRSDIISTSSQWQEIHGIRQSNLSMDELMPLAHPDDTEAVNKIFQKVIDGVSSSLEIEHRIIRPDNSEIRYIWALGEVLERDELGKPVSLSGFAQDITERKTLEISLKRFDRSLKNLVNVNQLIIHASSEQELYENICRSLVEVGGYKLSWIGLAIQDEKKTVRPCAEFGFDEGYIQSLGLSWADNSQGKGPTGTAIRTQKYSLAKDIHNDPKFETWRKSALEHGYQSSIAVPIIIDERAEGAINIYADELDAFDADEIELLVEMSDDLAFGIKSLRTALSNETSLQQLSVSLGQTVEAIALTVEMRDPYTAGHMTRVAELCVAIGRELGLSEHTLEGLRFGGTIHDLGKIYIPAEILNRPGKLSAAEFDLIKSHPQVGYDIVKGIDFPWPIAEMVLQHHERLDGSGYPNGLKGDEITLEAQILAVADVIEAVSSHRPYRPALSIEAGLDIVTKGKGNHYNTEVVEASLKLIREDGFKFTSVF